MPKETQEARLKAYFDNDFTPNSAVARSEDRIANAAEYSAHQLGRIRKLLEEMNERDKSR